MSNIQKKCETCHKIYLGDGYKNRCTKECYWKGVYTATRGLKPIKKKVVYERICEVCDEPFQTNRKNQRDCSFGCSQSRKSLTADEKIKRANLRWLDDKHKPPANKKGFRQLNREAEWRRVWDDNSWNNHYAHIRG
jgi:hypothetical protein